MNEGLHRGRSRESLGDLILRTNRLARAHIVSLGINERCVRVMTHSRRAVPLDPNTNKSTTNQSASSAPTTLTEMKIYKEYWDVLGVDDQDVTLRRKLLNGVNQEFVINKEEMEKRGLVGLRAGRRIAVWKDPETGKIQYELQRYTYLRMTPVLKAILDAEQLPQDTARGLYQQKDVADTASTPNHATGEILDPNRTIAVYIRGSHGQRERVVASKKDGFDIWACIQGSRAPYHGQCVFRSEFDDSQMISDKSDLLSYFTKGESIKTIQRGDYILARHLPQGGLQLHKIHEIELNLDFSHLPFTAEELQKYLNS